MEKPVNISSIRFDEQGLLPAVVQDSTSGEVLMVAYMNREALEKTIATGRVTFWSRSRGELWVKGESSGNYQYLKEMRIDCDEDTLLLLVKPAGPACHTGNKSCFFRPLEGGGEGIKAEVVEGKRGERQGEGAGASTGAFRQESIAILAELTAVIEERKNNPREQSYTSYLFQKGIDKICKKVGEEAAEVIIGAKNGSPEEIIYECADLIYHLLVLLSYYQIPLEKVFAELAGRRNPR